MFFISFSIYFFFFLFFFGFYGILMCRFGCLTCILGTTNNNIISHLHYIYSVLFVSHLHVNGEFNFVHISINLNMNPAISLACSSFILSFLSSHLFFSTSTLLNDTGIPFCLFLFYLIKFFFMSLKVHLTVHRLEFYFKNHISFDCHFILIGS